MVVDQVTKTEITLLWVQATVRREAATHALCSVTSPGCASPPYWPALIANTPENFAELERRIRLLMALTSSSVHGSEWAHLLKAWIKENMP
jgi:hypothetical protein